VETKSEYLDRLLVFCCENKATDLHICVGSKPMMRVNSKLTVIPNTDIILPMAVGVIVDAILSQKNRELLRVNRVLDFSFSRPHLGRFRCNIYQQRGSYAIAIRMLPFEIPLFSSLGLPPIAESFAHKHKGLVLITGTPGSGKSTTLASLINIINTTYNYHVVTIEDPIEYLHRHQQSLVAQREVGEDTDTFASALQATLREDPDIIMVGELHDPEVISMALTAAETGRLVLSTLHTVGVVKTLENLIGAFPVGQQNHARNRLATVLGGILSQQLLPRLDGPGLIAASEVLIPTPATRALIRDGHYNQVRSLMHPGHHAGMQLMEADLARLYHQGKIDMHEAQLRALDLKCFETAAAEAAPPSGDSPEGESPPPGKTSAPNKTSTAE